MREIHVAKTGCDSNPGTIEQPLLTITKAAELATSGDTILIHEGIYREKIEPPRGGACKEERITYTSYRDDKVTIKGSEIVKDWKKEGKGLWYAVIDNSLFGSYNPFASRLCGDWFHEPREYEIHQAEVYLNGRSLYEATSLEDVRNPKKRLYGVQPEFSTKTEKLLEPEFSTYVWRAVVDEKNTTIHCNFHEIDPNESLVEITVRPYCIFPSLTGIDYITVSNLELCQCAGNWNPPTSFQGGIVGPHWSKGWIIEDCDIHDGKTSGISIGRDRSTGANLSTTTGRKSGYQYQLETIFKVSHTNWTRETVGSHIIRRNRIHDCGENGIVGNLGGIFSKIHDNEIYNIAIKHEFFGAEIAGIKLHSPIDVEICRNTIRNCTLGTWLDWQLQGARISSNLYHDNDRDMFLEVSHGPYTVDNNIFASDYGFDNVSQGGAFINNLFAGAFRREAVLDRATPYHFRHSTEIAGYAFVYSGDDRFFNNLFIGGREIWPRNGFFGLADYNRHISSFEEYAKLMMSDRRDHSKYRDIGQPVYINHNVYLSGAEAYAKEEDNLILKDGSFKVERRQDGTTVLCLELPQHLPQVPVISSKELESPRISEAPFEDAEGNAILFDRDYLGTIRGKECKAGPLECLRKGYNEILLRKA